MVSGATGDRPRDGGCATQFRFEEIYQGDKNAFIAYHSTEESSQYVIKLGQWKGLTFSTPGTSTLIPLRLRSSWTMMPTLEVASIGDPPGRSSQ